MPETIFQITTPLDDAVIQELSAGDTVRLSGIVYTARDVAHQRLIDAIDGKGDLPFDLKGQVIYYVGPAPAPPGESIGSAGPTTAGRMDPFTAQLLDYGLKGMIGKGRRSDAVKTSIAKHRAVYFAAFGGAGAYLAACVDSVRIIAYHELGTEAIREMRVKDMPLIVAVDARGNDVYQPDGH